MNVLSKSLYRRKPVSSKVSLSRAAVNFLNTFAKILQLFNLQNAFNHAICMLYITFSGVKLWIGMVASWLYNNYPSLMKINFWRSKSGGEVDLILSDAKPLASLEVKAGGFKEIRISRGYRSFLLKYHPERAFLLNDKLWAEKEFSGSMVEAIPTSIFLSQGQL